MLHAADPPRRRRRIRHVGLRRISLTQWIIISMVVGVARRLRCSPTGAPSTAVGRRPTCSVLSTIFLRMIKSLIVPLLFAHARRGHRRPRRRHEARGPARVPVDRLLRDRHDARARRRPARGEHREAGRRASNLGAASTRGRRRVRDDADDVRGRASSTPCRRASSRPRRRTKCCRSCSSRSSSPSRCRRCRGRRRRSCSRLREPDRGDVQVRRHRDDVRAVRHRRGDRGHGRRRAGSACCTTSACSCCTLYGALIVFVLFVLVPVALIFRVPIRRFWQAVKEPWLIAFTTASSEAALPLAMQRMEQLGVPRRIVVVRAADRLLVQSRRQHALSRAGVGVRRRRRRASTCRSRSRSS